MIGGLGVLAEGGLRVGVAPDGGEVQAQRDFVAGEDVLPGDFGGLRAQVHHVHAHGVPVLPPAMHAGRQGFADLPVHPQQAGVKLRHFGHERRVAVHACSAGGAYAGQQVGGHAQIGRHGQHLRLHFVQALPVQTPRGGRDDGGQHAVFDEQGHFVLARLHAHKVLGHHLRLARHQVVAQRVREGAFFQIEGLGAQLVAPGRDAVLAWHEHAVKVAIAQEHGAFVFLDPYGFEAPGFHVFFSYGDSRKSFTPNRFVSKRFKKDCRTLPRQRAGA